MSADTFVKVDDQNNQPVREKRLPKVAREVQNKAPASRQITCEQIVREANEADIEPNVHAPTQQITDPDELRIYKMRKRKEFEDAIRRNRHSIGTWIKYASWEAKQKEFDRARNIFERVMDVDYRIHTIWLKYAEMEMSNGFVNRARNVWDRAVGYLPRVDQLWYKYAFMEEKLRQYENSRKIFERWMSWHPPKKAWLTYVNLEMRMAGRREHKLKRAREIFERFLQSHDTLDAYMTYAKWEQKQGQVTQARQIYQRAVEELEDDITDVNFFLKFAQFETHAREYERARAIYKYSLDNIPRHLAQNLFSKYVAFEKQHGDRGSIDEVILNKRRFEYEELLRENEHNYDVWFDYVKLEETHGNQNRIRETYERAVAALPPGQDKRYWKRYIYLWIKYALYEELIAEDPERTRAVYQLCLDTIPHEEFTFGKIWIMMAQFEIRQGKLTAARRKLGEALGRCPKKNIFNGYIELEYQLGEFGRCRKLYQKFLETFPEYCEAWIQFAQLEHKLREADRARAVFELGTKQELLDMPELLWKAYIDFEIANQEHERGRLLYTRLLDKTKHVKVWISMAQFEAGVVNSAANARKVFQQAENYFRNDADGEDATEQRVMLLEAWREFERMWGTSDQKNNIQKKMPKRVKKRRPLYTENGQEAGWEEYYDYIFPDEQKKGANMKLLEMARKWKKQKITTEGDGAAAA